MRLTFSEALDPAATGGRFMVDLATEPLSSAFHAAGAVTVEGAVVTVGLGEGKPRAEAGRLVGNRVTYIRRADGGGGALRDLAGNPVAAAHVMPYGGVETWRGSEEWRYVGIALDNVTAPPPDTVPPELVRGEIDGGTVTLWFSEELDPEAKAGRFHVQVQPAADRMQSFDAAGDVAIDGNRVTVGVGEGKPRARAGMTELNYAHYIAPLDPAAAGLRDLAGNPVATPLAFHGGERGTRSVKLDNVTPPAVTGVEVTSEAGDDDTYALRDVVRVTVTFSEAVVVTGAPRLKLALGAGDERWATYRRGSGTAALAFAYTVAQGDASSAGVAVLANTLALNGGTIRSRASGRDAALAHGGRGHDAAHKVDGALPDTTPPRLSRTAVDGTKLTLAFSEAIDAAASLTNGAFTVKKTPPGGTEETVGLSGSPAVDGAAVTLSLAKAVRGADRDVKVSYRKSDPDARNRLRDEAGNEVASFNNQPVSNSADTTPPRLVRGEIDGGTMTLYFSEPLDPDEKGGHFRVTLAYPCHPSAWLPRCASVFPATGNVEISGNVVTVGVGRRARAGLDLNRVFYLRPADPAAGGLRDLAGNPVKTPYGWIDGLLVTQIITLDNLTAPSVTGVAVSSDAGDDDTYALGEALELEGLHLGAVLGAFEVAHLLNDPVDGTVDPLRLGVQHVDEAPEQALALVGELRAVGGDALDQGMHRLLDAGERLVLVPDEAVVDLVRSGGGAVQRRVVADGGGGRAVVPGLGDVDVVGVDAGHGVSGLREGVAHRGVGGVAVGVGHDALLLFIVRATASGVTRFAALAATAGRRFTALTRGDGCRRGAGPRRECARGRAP